MGQGLADFREAFLDAGLFRPLLRPVRDPLVLAAGGYQGRDRDQGTADQAVMPVAGLVQQADRVIGVGHQEDNIAEEQHCQSAGPAEQIAVAHDHGALVIISGQLGNQRGRRDLAAGHQHPYHDRDDQQIGEDPAAQARRRRPQQDPCKAQRDRRNIEPGQALAPFCIGPVAEMADDRVRKGIDKQRQHQRQRHQPGIKADNLIVEEQQKGRKAVVLYAIGD